MANVLLAAVILEFSGTECRENIQYLLEVCGRGWIDEMAAVGGRWGCWINCFVALHNFPE